MADAPAKADKKKKPKKTLTDLEDVVSLGALLRPTIEEALSEVKASQMIAFRDIVTEAERVLAQSSSPLSERFEKTVRVLERTYVYGPLWRFVVGKIQEVSANPELGVKELSLVSMIVGSVFEAVDARVPKNRVA